MPSLKQVFQRGIINELCRLYTVEGKRKVYLICTAVEGKRKVCKCINVELSVLSRLKLSHHFLLKQAFQCSIINELCRLYIVEGKRKRYT